jgi:hypothetical protein
MIYGEQEMNVKGFFHGKEYATIYYNKVEFSFTLFTYISLDSTVLFSTHNPGPFSTTQQLKFINTYV